MSLRIKIGNNTFRINQLLDIQNSSLAVKYLQSNQLICINLWATWCVPCIEEMQMLNEIKIITLIKMLNLGVIDF